MKKNQLAFVISFLSLIPNATASNNPEELLRSFVRRAIFRVELDTSEARDQSYLGQKSVALSKEILNWVSLETKYNCVNDIYIAFNKARVKQCEPELIAERILESIPKTVNVDLTAILGTMKTFIKFIYPTTTNANFVLNDVWAFYTIRQARNAELPVSLRRKFAKLYPKCTKSQDGESFMRTLLMEIDKSEAKQDAFLGNFHIDVDSLDAILNDLGS